MPADVTRGEFQALQQEVEGEKLVTRHILEQTRRNGDDLAAIKTRLERVEEKLDGVDLKGLVRKVDGLETKVDALDRKIESKVDGLAKSLPGVIRDAFFPAGTRGGARSPESSDKPAPRQTRGCAHGAILIRCESWKPRAIKALGLQRGAAGGGPGQPGDT